MEKYIPIGDELKIRLLGTDNNLGISLFSKSQPLHFEFAGVGGGGLNKNLCAQIMKILKGEIIQDGSFLPHGVHERGNQTTCLDDYEIGNLLTIGEVNGDLVITGNSKKVMKFQVAISSIHAPELFEVLMLQKGIVADNLTWKKRFNFSE